MHLLRSLPRTQSLRNLSHFASESSKTLEKLYFSKSNYYYFHCWLLCVCAFVSGNIFFFWCCCIDAAAALASRLRNVWLEMVVAIAHQYEHTSTQTSDLVAYVAAITIIGWAMPCRTSYAIAQMPYRMPNTHRWPRITEGNQSERTLLGPAGRCRVVSARRITMINDDGDCDFVLYLTFPMPYSNSKWEPNGDSSIAWFWTNRRGDKIGRWRSASGSPFHCCHNGARSMQYLVRQYRCHGCREQERNNCQAIQSCEAVPY